MYCMVILHLILQKFHLHLFRNLGKLFLPCVESHHTESTSSYGITEQCSPNWIDKVVKNNKCQMIIKNLSLMKRRGSTGFVKYQRYDDVHS